MSATTAGVITSIVIPCWNQLEFTRKCISGLFRQTGPNWELIVVDNGSTDGTGNYLAGVQDAARVAVTLITNTTNRGFPAAVNQGLQYARGEYLVLLNNDVVVTEGWLDQLVALTSASLAGPKSQVPNLKSREGIVESGPLVSRPYPGRNITLIDLQPVNQDENGAAGDQRATIGLVGPMSNYAAPPQLVEDVPYQDLNDMKDFARRWREQHRGEWFTVPKLSGFCLLMKRAVYDAVGGLDERFGLGLFDDDDLAERARRAGFELAVAHDLFVHHFGSRTFVGNGIDANRLLDENAAKFAAKWGDSAPRGVRVALKAFPAGPTPRRTTSKGCVPTNGPFPSDGSFDARCSSDAGPSLAIASAGRARVSLTMIVRDEEKNLPRALESVREIFDEIVVVDTGSADRTREIAREHGAKVFEFAWIDDFAAARNAALDRATGNYAFWLDADDVIEPPEREKLRVFLDGLRAGDEAGFVVYCACDPGADGSGGETVVDHIRLFPVRPEIRWIYRVHEQILPSLRRAGIPVRRTELVVRHTGYADVALRARKLERDTRILLEELKERPDEPFILFNLGAIAIERRDWGRALQYLRSSLEHSAPSDSITCKLFALIARAYQMLNDTGPALRVCAEGLSLDPVNAELWFRKAVVHRQRGESTEAGACWRAILSLSRPDRFMSMDMGIYGHLTRRNLAVLAAERGDREEEAQHWRAVLAECPGDREALAKLGLPATNG